MITWKNAKLSTNDTQITAKKARGIMLPNQIKSDLLFDTSGERSLLTESVLKMRLRASLYSSSRSSYDLLLCADSDVRGEDS